MDLEKTEHLSWKVRTIPVDGEENCNGGMLCVMMSAKLEIGGELTEASSVGDSAKNS